MASPLRSKRGRQGGSGGAQPLGNDECPVCLTAMPRGQRTEDARVNFPCGHAVCSTCDGIMQRRGFHSCPLCRTPREGFSQAEVNVAAEARTLADAAADGEADPETMVQMWAVNLGRDTNQATFEEFILSRNGPPRRGRAGAGWHIMFFPNEAQGDPFDVLRAAAAGGARLGDDSSGGLVSRRVRHSSRVRDEAPEQSDEESEDVQRGAGAAPPLPVNQSPRSSAVIDREMQELITNHLLQPTDLPTFLAHHRALTRPRRGARSAPG